MASNVLSEQYVDIVIRGLRETMQQLRDMQRQAGMTGDSMRKSLAQSMGGANQLPRQANPVNQARPAANVGPNPLSTVGGLLPGGLGAIIGAATPVGAAAAAISASLALINQGLQGTAELEQFGMAFTNIAREVGNVFAPVVRLVTAVLNQLTGTFRGTGAAGQQFLMLMTSTGIILEVFSNPAVQSSIKGLMVSFGGLVQALQPLLNLFANIGSALLDTFVVAPLLEFTKALTFIVTLMAEMTKLAMQTAQSFASLFGMSRLFSAPQRGRFESTLNQTGTEDAAGTFQRIQQAVFKASSGEPEGVEDKQLAELQAIKGAALKLIEDVQALTTAVSVGFNTVAGAATSTVQNAQGTSDAAKLGLGNLFLGGFIR